MFKQTSRASKLLALVPPINAPSDGENETSSDEEVFISTCRQDSDDLSSEAPSIPSSLENLNIFEDDEDRNNASGDEIPNSEPEDQELAVPLTPIINQVLPSTSQVNFDNIPTLSSIQSIPSVQDISPIPNAVNTRSKRRRYVNTQSRVHNIRPKKRKPTDYKWKKGKFLHKAEITNCEFKNNLHADFTPIDYFWKYFSLDILQDIVHNTNLYAVQVTGRSINISEDEMKDFIAILLLMGVVNLPSYVDYWSKELRYPAIAEIMSLKKFETIRRYIHFADNSCPDSDRYFKVRPFVEKVRRNCLATEEEMRYSIDEMTIPYKGKKAGNRRQYNPMKPNKWGFKNFVRAGMSGIVYDFLLYGGEDTFRYIQFSQAEETLTLGAKVVVALCKTIQTRACVVYFDNYFSTLDLAIHLRDECGIFSLGTIRQNRLKGCDKLLMSDKSLKKKGRGSYCQVVDNTNKIAIVKWYDNKVVTLISTYADAYPVGKIKRYSKEMKARVDVDCPELIKHYNNHMGGVDLADMLVALYRTTYKSRRWYTAIFAQMLDICVNNAWLLYRRDCSNRAVKNMPLKSFRCQLARELQNKSRSRISVNHNCRTDDSIRYDSIGHFPSFGESYGRCKLCIKNKTDVYCVKCNQRLCLVRKRNCFYDYHSK